MSLTISRVLYLVVIYLLLMLPLSSSNLPENMTGRHIVLCLVLLRMGFTLTFSVTRKAVVSYTAISPLPVSKRHLGCIISVALSFESPRPAVNRHPALRSPDFPHDAISILRLPVRLMFYQIIKNAACSVQST